MSNFEQVKASHQEKMNDIKLPKKTADEMFEELGYTRTSNSDYMTYVKEARFKKDERIISFHISEKIYSLFKEKSYSAGIVSQKEHLAIHQKLIELGWLDMSE